jgi:monovalent cation/proton antiporter MnhG/PhaG subunit
MIFEFIISFFILFGVTLQLLASFGLLRFPSFIYRLQASSKASTLGFGVILLAAAIHFNTLEVWIKAILAIVFLSITSPAVSTFLARTYLNKDKR